MGKKIVRRLFIWFFLGFSFIHKVLAISAATGEDIENLFQNLTVSERTGQLIDFRVSPTAQNIEAILTAIRENHIGSVTIAGGDPDMILALINRLPGLTKVPVFVSVEQRQLSNLPFGEQSALPQSATFVAAGDQNLYYRGVNRLAALLSGLSVNSVSYSPAMVDIRNDSVTWENVDALDSGNFTDGFSGILATRQLAATLPVRFRFSNDFGFSPRNLNINQFYISAEDRLKLSRVNQRLTILQIVDFPAFAENEAVLFQKKVMTPLLWKEWQFSGIIAADLDKITGARFSQPKKTDVRTLLKCGVDKIIISADPGLVQEAILDGLNSRFIRQNEIMEKVKRILSLKTGVMWHNEPTDDIALSRFATDRQLGEIAYRTYNAAAKLLDFSPSFLPIDQLEDRYFATLTIGQTSHSTFQEVTEKYAPCVHFTVPGFSINQSKQNELRDRLAHFDYVFVGVFPNGLLAFDQSVIDFLHNLTSSTRVVLVFFGNPKAAFTDFERFPHKLIMFEDNQYTQQIAPQIIFGAVNRQNSRQRLGYSLPEIEGMDGSVLAKVDAIAREAIEIGATPGMQILVARHGNVVLEKGYGFTTYDSLTEVDTRSLYDLASVTKVLATTPVVMNLYETGQVVLDSTMGFYLKELSGTNKADLKIRDVLAHRSGLRAFYPFWRFTARTPEAWNYYYRPFPSDTVYNTVVPGMYATPMVSDSLWKWTAEMKLQPRRRTTDSYGYKYSDLGFYLLQLVAERISHHSLDALTDSLFYKPMGMATLGFNPLCRFPQSIMAPTELDLEFRNMLVWGNVHDQMAAMTGGVGGHAGLFGNAHDAAKFMQMMLQHGSYGGKNYFTRETVDLFTATVGKESRRGLGWDKPETGRGEHPASRYASFASFGHTGFTGTIVWADPTFDLVFVMLSNRVHPSAENNKLTTFNIRKRIQDLVYESIWSFEKQIQ